MFYIIQACWCSPGSRASFADDTGDDGASFKPQLEARLSCRLSHFPPNVKKNHREKVASHLHVKFA